MAYPIANIFASASLLLNDDENVRWTPRELVIHYNSALMEYVRLRPDQTATQTVFTLAEGHRQALPVTSYVFVGVPANSTGRRRRITPTSISLLDLSSPNWRSMTPATEIIHVSHDLREPRVFQVYPPAKAGTQVDLVSAPYPTLTSVPAEGTPLSSITGDIPLPDHAAEALLNFVMFKAYAKDVEVGGNAATAAQYLALFNNALGTQLQSSATVSTAS